MQDAARREFAAEWTPEVTAARRKMWNDAALSGKLSTASEIVSWSRKHGWGMVDLKRAMDLHK